MIKNHKIITWWLPDGFVVEQKYFKREEVNITSTLDGKAMGTLMQYRTDQISNREHEQAITANVIHSLDAYHLRKMVTSAKDLNISIFPLHDCIIVDVGYIRVMKEVARSTFNLMYKDPDSILNDVYHSILKANSATSGDKDVLNRINSIMGTANIRATKDLFN